MSCADFFLDLGDRLYNRYINGISTPNVSDSITSGLLMEKSMKKYPKTLKTIKYEPTCVLRGATRELQHLARGGGGEGDSFTLR